MVLTGLRKGRFDFSFCVEVQYKDEWKQLNIEDKNNVVHVVTHNVMKIFSREAMSSHLLFFNSP